MEMDHMLSRSIPMSKDMIASDVVLTHFDPDAPISLACDASSYDLGAVLSHVDKDGQ